MSDVNPFEPPQAESVMPVSGKEAPAIWNPNAAANWSLLFSPAFGAILHALNAKQLGRPEEVKRNQIWVAISIGFQLVSLFSILVPASSDVPFRLVALIILLTWYFSSARKQAKYVKETYGNAYPRRSWGLPLLIGFACFVGVVGFAIGLGVVAQIILGVEPMPM